MNILVSIAPLAGYLYSLGTTFFAIDADFYWEISILAVFILLGYWDGDACLKNSCWCNPRTHKTNSANCKFDKKMA